MSRLDSIVRTVLRRWYGIAGKSRLRLDGIVDGGATYLAAKEGARAGLTFGVELQRAAIEERRQARLRVHAFFVHPETGRQVTVCQAYDCAPFEVGPRRTADPDRVTCRSCHHAFHKWPQLGNLMRAQARAATRGET